MWLPCHLHSTTAQRHPRLQPAVLLVERLWGGLHLESQRLPKIPQELRHGLLLSPALGSPSEEISVPESSSPQLDRTAALRSSHCDHWAKLHLFEAFQKRPSPRKWSARVWSQMSSQLLVEPAEGFIWSRLHRNERIQVNRQWQINKADRPIKTQRSNLNSRRHVWRQSRSECLRNRIWSFNVL